MFKCHFSILCIMIHLFNQSYAEFWCSDQIKETLIHCLLEKPIIAAYEYHGLEYAEFYRRLQCARYANCIKKPWDFDIFDDRIEIVKKFAKCMDDVATWLEQKRKTTQESVHIHKTLHHFEQQCRSELASKLPDNFKMYYWQLLGKEKYFLFQTLG